MHPNPISFFEILKSDHSSDNAFKNTSYSRSWYSVSRWVLYEERIGRVWSVIRKTDVASHPLSHQRNTTSRRDSYTFFFPFQVEEFMMKLVCLRFMLIVMMVFTLQTIKTCIKFSKAINVKKAMLSITWLPVMPCLVNLFNSEPGASLCRLAWILIINNLSQGVLWSELITSSWKIWWLASGVERKRGE